METADFLLKNDFSKFLKDLNNLRDFNGQIRLFLKVSLYNFFYEALSTF